jgi:tRNA(Ile)-lysidine synthase
VLRSAALAAGCPGGELFAVHVDAVDRLITDWHGQGSVDLPGGVRVTRRNAALRFQAGPPTGG